MSRKFRLPILVFLVSLFLIVSFVYLKNSNIPILEPAGPIGHKERNLIMLVVLLSLIVVIPVYGMLVGFALRYREANKKSKYQPSFDHSRLIESVWWGVPLIIITILAIVTWNSSRDLDPFKQLSSQSKPLKVQVVALQWKWLFIYPEQDIASVNFLEMPIKTPVNFEITADAPMNSFWIPQLGGQIYAMNGMSTQLHLMASKTGDYQGSSANISGTGFADMKFTAKAVSEDDFNKWVNSVKYRSNPRDEVSLAQNNYLLLANPYYKNLPVTYTSVKPGLYETIVSKYNHPPANQRSPS